MSRLPEQIGPEALRDRGMDWPRRHWALLDIRDAGEHEEGHLPGATSLPRRMLEFRALDLIPDPAWPVVVYDSGTYGDKRAGRAAHRLQEIGCANVGILRGGIHGWTAGGGELARGVNVPCKRFGEKVLHGDAVPQITPDQFAELRTSGGHVLCDVRTSGEFAHHHLDGAMSYPGFELAAHLPGLARNHGRVIVNCAGRTRSIIAAATVRALGFDGAALENGTMGWRLAGREVEAGAGKPGRPPETEDMAAITEKARALALGQGVVVTDAPSLSAAQAEGGKARPTVVDVRPLEVFADGHVPGAICLPGGQVVQTADDHLAVPGAPVVLMDDGDARAWLAAWWLKRMGFESVSVLGGGYPAWRDAGQTVETGRGRTRPGAVDRIAAQVPVISTDELKYRTGHQGGPILVDVSSSRAFAKAHIPGAIWISRGWLEDEIRRHASPGDMIVVIAGEPIQAQLGAAALQQAGYGGARALSAGMREWIASGGAVQSCDRPAHAMDVVEPPYAKGLQAMRDYLDWEIRLTEDAKPRPAEVESHA